MPHFRAFLVLLLPLLLTGQGRGRVRVMPNLEYNGQFVFARIRYGGFSGYGGSTWSHDYPRADQHLSRILHDLTTISAALNGSNVFELTDPEMFRYPFIYVSEPGYWVMSDADAASLRAYLLKGGFIVFDDFEEEHLLNVEAQMRRSLPELHMIEIEIDHPIFDSFFRMKSIDFPHPMQPYLRAQYFGIFEDNDPRKRMLAMINHNSDLAEYWEWSATGMFPVDITSDAYKLGVNYVVFGMTH
ncbi:MAG: DUF4159 domain-containing protein [Gemmatimonadetes bacterium]|nr:DUF4159 domain-containing protein [Gemmatimonadota bacterium]